jgi:hypothetical protein
VESGPVCEVFLRQPKATSQFPDSGPERRPQILHAGIVPSGMLPRP